MNRIKFFLLLLCMGHEAYPVYIVIHGTFAEDSKWSRPGGKFYVEVEQEAYNRRQHLIPFGWSGDNEHEDRIQGGMSLAKVILSYPPCEEHIVIGHSHAGNVIALASQFLADDPEAYLGVCHQRQMEADRSEFPRDSYLCAMEEIQKIKRHALARAGGGENHNFYIDRAYFLGTPVNEKYYMPDMTVIKHLYNCYSKGDLVQPVFFLYNRLFSSHPHISNLRFTLEGAGWLGLGNPTHGQMHNPIIARWLLSMPFDLKEQGVGGFDLFTEGCNGAVHFPVNGSPAFTLEKNS